METQSVAVHADADVMMKSLGAAMPVNTDFEPTLTALMAAVREHIADEEDATFPQLTAACTAGHLDDLGRRMAEAKKVETTRTARRRPVGRR